MVSLPNRRDEVFLEGAVLYFLLTDQTPSGEKPRAINPKISKPAEAICLKAMARDRGNRYAGATDLSADVNRLLDSEPVSAYRENAYEKVSRWISKNRFLVLLVLAYLLMRIFFIFSSRS